MTDPKSVPDQVYDAYIAATLEAIKVVRQVTTGKNEEGKHLPMGVPTADQINAARFVIDHAATLLPVLNTLRPKRGPAAGSF